MICEICVMFERELIDMELDVEAERARLRKTSRFDRAVGEYARIKDLYARHWAECHAPGPRTATREEDSGPMQEVLDEPSR